MNDMPSRMENKGQQHGRKKLWWVLGIILIVALVVGGLAYAYSGSDEDSGASSSSSAKKVNKPTTKSSQKSKSSSESSASSDSVSADDLVGLGFQIMPVLFNGEDATQAMNEGKAQPSLVHDGSQLGYFKNNTEARMTGIAGYMYAHTANFSVVDGVLEMNTWNIPVKVSNGTIQTTQWGSEDTDGNHITWKIEALSDAQSTVEAHKNANESSSSTNSGSVDQHNLTSAQMEHWVRSYIESGSQVYTASDYTFTQKFVNGYAQIYEYTRKPKTNKNDLWAVFRVDEHGYLQQESEPGSNNWRIVSKQYE